MGGGNPVKLCDVKDVIEQTGPRRPNADAEAKTRLADMALEWNVDAGIGYIYFIQCGKSGPIKVGITDNVKRRLKTLQCANPCKLELLLAFLGGEVMECALHRKFSAHRLRGEWFEPAPPLTTFITDLSRAIHGDPKGRPVEGRRE